MTIIRKYKHIAAALLLALYTFIVAPVQLWHHHSRTEKKTQVIANDARQNAVSKALDTGSDNSCQICAHKYSIYYDDVPGSVASPAISAAEKNGYYFLPVTAEPSFALPNKGPPSFS